MPETNTDVIYKDFKPAKKPSLLETDYEAIRKTLGPVKSTKAAPKKAAKSTVDYDALAAEFGGQVGAGAPDYDALASEFGGAVVAAPTPTAAAQDKGLGHTVQVVSDAVAPYGVAAMAGGAGGSFIPGIGTGIGAGAGVVALGLGDLATSGFNLVSSPFGGPQLTTPSNAIRGLTRAGGLTAAPETEVERFLHSAVSGAAGGYSGAYSLNALAATPAAGNYMRELMTTMGAQPGVQAVAGGTAGLSAQGAAELGAPPVVQVLAGLAGGAAGGMGAQAAAPKPTLAGARPAPTIEELAATEQAAYKAAADAGVSWSPAQARDLLQEFNTTLRAANVNVAVPDSVRTFMQSMEKDISNLSRQGKSVDFLSVDRWRRQLADLYKDRDAGRIATLFRDTLDTFLENPDTSTTTARAKVSDARVALKAAQDEADKAQAAVKAAAPPAGPAENARVPVDLGWSAAKKAATGVDKVDVLVNPTPAQMQKLSTVAPEARAQTNGAPQSSLRYLRDADGNLHVWRGDLATHEEIAGAVNLPLEGVNGATSGAKAGKIDLVGGKPAFDGNPPATQSNFAATAAAKVADAKLRDVKAAHDAEMQGWVTSDPEIKPLLAARNNTETAAQAAETKAAESAALATKQDAVVAGYKRPPKAQLEAQANYAKQAKTDAQAATTARAKAAAAHRAFANKAEDLAPVEAGAVAKAKAAHAAQTEAANAARTASRQKRLGEKIDDIVAKVDNQATGEFLPDTAGKLRRGLQAFVRSKDFQRLRGPEQAAVLDALKASPVEKVLSFVGGFTPGKGLRGLLGIAGDLAVLSHSPLAAIGTGVVAPGSRAAANSMARARIERLGATLRGGTAGQQQRRNLAPVILPSINAMVQK